MFLLQYTRRQRCFVVIRIDGDHRLGNDASCIDVFGHEVNRRSVHTHTIVQRLAMCAQTRKQRQQRRMDVDQAPGVTAYEVGCQHAHETGEDDEDGMMTIDLVRECALKFGTPGVATMLDDRGRDPRPLCHREPARVGATADGGNNGCIQRRLPVFGSGRLQQRFEIASAPGDQHDDVLHRRELY